MNGKPPVRICCKCVPAFFGARTKQTRNGPVTMLEAWCESCVPYDYAKHHNVEHLNQEEFRVRAQWPTAEERAEFIKKHNEEQRLRSEAYELERAKNPPKGIWMPEPIKKTKLIFIVGSPGSGKTFLGNKLAQETGFDFIDDVDMYSKQKLYSTIASGKSCIAADPNLVITSTRIHVEASFQKYPNLEIEWIFFENNPEQCLKNVIKRNDGRKVNEFIRIFSRHYEIPEGAKVIPVYKDEE